MARTYRKVPKTYCRHQAVKGGLKIYDVTELALTNREQARYTFLKTLQWQDISPSAWAEFPRYLRDKLNKW